MSRIKKTKRLASQLEAMVRGHNQWSKQWDEAPYDPAEAVPLVDQRMASIVHLRLVAGLLEVPHGGFITLMAEWQEMVDGSWSMNWLSVAFDGTLQIAYQRER